MDVVHGLGSPKTVCLHVRLTTQQIYSNCVERRINLIVTAAAPIRDFPSLVWSVVHHDPLQNVLSFAAHSETEYSHKDCIYIPQ